MDRLWPLCILGIVLGTLPGCASLGNSGPSTSRVIASSKDDLAGSMVQLIEVNDEVAEKLYRSAQPTPFSEALADTPATRTKIGFGDVLDVTVWEAPPAVLFGMLNGKTKSSPISDGGSTGIPAQMVDENGAITLPYIGSVKVANRTPHQVEEEIRQRLTGIANFPQVIVSIAHNNSSNVTVLGEVAASSMVPLTPRGERVLDVLAAAGGVRQQVDKITIQVTRAGTVASMPMQNVIQDPLQNVRLQPEDVVTAIFQPYSFTALGASGLNAEVPFEASGISLSQALGRINGLRDDRANTRGVFVFRWEDAKLVDPTDNSQIPQRGDGKTPVIYRVDISDPKSFFVAQNFPLKNKDVVYVSNASGVELQKFVSLLSQTAFSIIGITNFANGK